MAGFSILKKGPEKDKKPEEKKDIPEELPPLGEEAIKKDDKTAQDPKVAVPDELPEIDIGQPQPSPIPDEISLDLPEEKPVESQIIEEPKTEISGNGFFAGLFSAIKKPSVSNRLYKEDLLARMKENWEVKDTAMKEGVSVSDENEMQRQLETTLNDLRLAESRWRTQKIALEENQRMLKEREDEIRKKSEDFKKILRKTQLLSPVPKEKVLILKNAITIRNITELIAALKKMDKKIFALHYSSTKNDFYDFVRHINYDVANRIKLVKTKSAMAAELEEAVKETLKE